jgi:hypothetical protein
VRLQGIELSQIVELPEDHVGGDSVYLTGVECGKSIFGLDCPESINISVRLIQTRQQRLNDQGSIDGGQGKGRF